MAFKSDKQRKYVMGQYKNKSFKQLKKSGVYLRYQGDEDKDGVKNIHDCAPLNPKRHYQVSSISDKSKLGDIRDRIQLRLKNMGYNANVSVSGNNVRLQTIRKRSYNLQKKFGDEGYKRTRALSWDDWVKVNNGVNDVLDNLKINANVKSLGGKFDIRSKSEGRRERRDWDFLAGENVGSIMSPVAREDYILDKDTAIDFGLPQKDINKLKKVPT